MIKNKVKVLSVFNKILLSKRTSVTVDPNINDLLNCPIEELDKFLEFEGSQTKEPQKPRKQSTDDRVKGDTYNKVNEIISHARRASLAQMPNLRKSSLGTISKQNPEKSSILHTTPRLEENEGMDKHVKSCTTSSNQVSQLNSNHKLGGTANSQLDRGFVESEKSHKGTDLEEVKDLNRILDFKETNQEQRSSQIVLAEGSPIQKAKDSEEFSGISWNKCLPPITNRNRSQRKKKTTHFLKNIKASGFTQYITHKAEKKW